MVQNHSPFYNKPMQSLNPKDLQFGTVSLHYFFSLILIPHSNYHLLFPNKKVYICILFFPVRKVNTFYLFFCLFGKFIYFRTGKLYNYCYWEVV